MNGYNGYAGYNGYYPYQGTFGVGPQPTKYEIIRVNGENGARAFRMAPNSQCLLLDDTAPLIWLAQTDGAGYKTVVPYIITPYQQEDPVDTRSLEQRIKRLEDMLNEKSYPGATGAKHDGPTAVPAE